LLRSYLPVLVFAGLGILVGGLLAAVNGLIGPRKPNKAKSDPYECGLPSEVTRTFRFGLSFYMIAMLFILFDIEVVFLYPVGVIMKLAHSVFVLVEVIVFVNRTLKFTDSKLGQTIPDGGLPGDLTGDSPASPKARGFGRGSPRRRAAQRRVGSARRLAPDAKSRRASLHPARSHIDRSRRASPSFRRQKVRTHPWRAPDGSWLQLRGTEESCEL
jgi:NADH-quinone oxidoreductase subunit A